MGGRGRAGGGGGGGGGERRKAKQEQQEAVERSKGCATPAHLENPSHRLVSRSARSQRTTRCAHQRVCACVCVIELMMINVVTSKSSSFILTSRGAEAPDVWVFADT